MGHLGNIGVVLRGKAGDGSAIDNLLNLRYNRELFRQNKTIKLLPNLMYATGEVVGFSMACF